MEDNSKDYKDTLNLPQTGFPMKANLPAREPEMLRHWSQQGTYEKMIQSNGGATPYILHDGPPYANGHIHIGHALNKVLKDIIVKYKSMRGMYAPYVPGWDCHGLPIELEVDKKLGKDKASVPLHEKRLMCRQYAAGFVDVQREEFKRLGVFGKWDEPYLTMAYPYEADILRQFYEFYERGFAYKGKKPVHWCPSCVTALAEAEVEYADKTSPSVFVRFTLEDESAAKLSIAGKNAAMVIWTTTPWTLPANMALAVRGDIEYAAMNSGGAVLIVASGLVDTLREKGVLAPDAAKVAAFKGEELVGLRAEHPFIDRASVVIEGDFVTTEEGTGIVHIAPGHGEDDYVAGLRAGLDILAPVNDHGKFAGSGVEAIEDMFVFKANDTIKEILTERGALLGAEDLTHSYPHCWRCKKPVIFRATEQWFISMAHGDLRDKCLEQIDGKVRWVPSWGRDRIRGMVQNRPDWCISRQRAWGVPIAVLSCSGCGHLVNDKAVNTSVVERFKESGAEVWFTHGASELLPEGYECPGCGGGAFEKEMDILDVWFDSGVSYAATLKPERGFPAYAADAPAADMYLEGSDQHRGWFQSSLLASVGVRGCAPYRTVLTHGFTVDGRGKKMSKSQGNVVAPQDIIKQTGAEILRLWVSAEDYTGDIKISKEILARLTEAYRKIRNTAKYLLGNISDFPGGDYGAGLLPIDRWAMARLQFLIEDVTRDYEDFRFHMVYNRLYQFCIVDMSSFYLDILKDRLYTFGRDSKERRAAQWVLREILLAITRLMAPVLSFTAEEIWSFIEDRPAESVFLGGFPKVLEQFKDKDIVSEFSELIVIRNEANRAMELKRAEKFIGSSLDARIVLHVSDPAKLGELERKYGASLATYLIVSQAAFSGQGAGQYRSSAETMPWLSITVLRADGGKCSRCWNYSTQVGTFKDEPELCERCHPVIKALDA